MVAARGGPGHSGPVTDELLAQLCLPGGLRQPGGRPAVLLLGGVEAPFPRGLPACADQPVRAVSGIPLGEASFLAFLVRQRDAGLLQLFRGVRRLIGQRVPHHQEMGGLFLQHRQVVS